MKRTYKCGKCGALHSMDDGVPEGGVYLDYLGIEDCPKCAPKVGALTDGELEKLRERLDDPCRREDHHVTERRQLLATIAARDEEITRLEDMLRRVRKALDGVANNTKTTVDHLRGQARGMCDVLDDFLGGVP